MHRFYLPPEQCRGSALCLTGREAHHALHVLRLRVGERTTTVDGAGQELVCEVRATERQAVHLSIVERKSHAAPNCRITLLQAIPKGKLFEAIVQKATELGAFRIVPLITERVVSKFDRDEAADKAEKWRQVAVEAIKQCGSPWLPQVELPQTPVAFLSHQEHFELPLVAALTGESRRPRDYFREFGSREGRLPASLCVWIGPEGDFTPQEMERIKTSGARPITLGPRVLRTETAAIYCLSILSYELQSTPG